MSELIKYQRREDLNFGVEKHLGLVHKIANLFTSKSKDRNMYMDYVQDGCFGLMHAYRKFDPSLGYKFSTYAKNWIVRSMQTTYRKSFSVDVGRPTFNKEGIRSTIPITVVDDKDDVACISIEGNSNIVKETFFRVVERTLKEKIFKLLDIREKKVIEEKYYNYKSFSEIGIDLGLSKQRTQQLETIAVRKLREDKDIQRLYPLYQELLYSF